MAKDCRGSRNKGRNEGKGRVQKGMETGVIKGSKEEVWIKSRQGERNVRRQRGIKERNKKDIIAGEGEVEVGRYKEKRDKDRERMGYKIGRRKGGWI